MRHRGVGLGRRTAQVDELHVWRMTDGTNGGAPVPGGGIALKVGVTARRTIRGGRGGLTIKGEQAADGTYYRVD